MTETAEKPITEKKRKPVEAVVAPVVALEKKAGPKLEKAAKAKKGLGPKIDPRAAEFLGQTWDSANEGATWLLEAMPGLYRRTLTEIRGKFDEKQARLVLDAFNGFEAGPSLAGQRILIAVRNGVEAGGLDEKWGVDGKALLKAIGALTAFQAVTLEFWSNQFWRGPYTSEAQEKAHLALIVSNRKEGAE